MQLNSKIFVAGHKGLVGQAIVSRLIQLGYQNLVTRDRKDLDLTIQQDVEIFFARERPEYVIVAAGLVGGIRANSESPADFYYVNSQIANNVIWSAYRHSAKKLLYLGSACMYPKECKQPMVEEDLLNGLPEITNEGYALAKIGGSRLCSYINRQYGREFISAIPANTYGANDCFDPEKSHVIPALFMKYHKAKENHLKCVELWGTGAAKREFIYNEDLADGCVFLMNHYSEPEPINMGTGSEITILELAEMIRKIVGYEGEILCDPTKPDGMMRRIMNNAKMEAMGWRSTVSLDDGLRRMYAQYCKML